MQAAGRGEREKWRGVCRAPWGLPGDARCRSPGDRRACLTFVSERRRPQQWTRRGESVGSHRRSFCWPPATARGYKSLCTKVRAQAPAAICRAGEEAGRQAGAGSGDFIRAHDGISAVAAMHGNILILVRSGATT